MTWNFCAPFCLTFDFKGPVPTLIRDLKGPVPMLIRAIHWYIRDLQSRKHKGPLNGANYYLMYIENGKAASHKPYQGMSELLTIV